MKRKNGGFIYGSETSKMNVEINDKIYFNEMNVVNTTTDNNNVRNELTIIVSV